MADKQAVIIGGGVGGLATACLLGKAGYAVTVIEKNEQLGGRAGLLETNGFRFDTGPSWYLMPDVFEHFFELLGEDVHDHLKLVKLSPSYRVFYKGTGQRVDMTGDFATDAAAFAAMEPGADAQLEKYLTRSAYMYKTSVERFLYKNYDRLSDFLTPEVMKAGAKMAIFSTMDRYVRRYFRDPRLQKIMEYPLVFLGASPYNAPALYSLMSHVDFTQGVYYPMGGMYEFVQALVGIGKRHGVQYVLNTPAEQIVVTDGQARGVVAGGKTFAADVVISDADIHHTETKLLQPTERDHSPRYWRSRTLAPSALLMYLGVDKQYPSLAHHNLLFSEDWRRNFAEIFGKQPGLHFPTDPSLYVCAPGKTDPSVAPKGKENLFVLVPLASGLQYTDDQLAAYAQKTLQTLETELDLPGLRSHISFEKLFCVKDFASRFHSLQGTGLGLAHTLRQTAIFRPRNMSRKVGGLYYVGANVHPGIGLPTTLISAELAYKRLTGDRSHRPLSSL
jgi:phytoene desaturase